MHNKGLAVMIRRAVKVIHCAALIAAFFSWIGSTNTLLAANNDSIGAKQESTAKPERSAFALVQSGTGYRNYAVVGESTNFPLGTTVYVVSTVVRASNTSIKHVWKNNQTEIWSIDLKKAKSNNWTTSSRRLLNQPGLYEVSVISASGLFLGKVQFSITTNGTTEKPRPDSSALNQSSTIGKKPSKNFINHKLSKQMPDVTNVPQPAPKHVTIRPLPSNHINLPVIPVEPANPPVTPPKSAQLPVQHHIDPQEGLSSACEFTRQDIFKARGEVEVKGDKNPMPDEKFKEPRNKYYQPEEIFRYYPQNNNPKKEKWKKYLKLVISYLTSKNKYEEYSRIPDDLKRMEAMKNEKQKSTQFALDLEKAIHELIDLSIKNIENKFDNLMKDRPDYKEIQECIEEAAKARAVEVLAKCKQRMIDLRSEILAEAKKYEHYTFSEERRITYNYEVDGFKISLKDHINAYATIAPHGMEGGSATIQNVAKIIDDSPISSSNKKILKVISSLEGGFSTVNTWDCAILTWGFMQWTKGCDSDLTKTLAYIKKNQSAAFCKRFSRYGIEIGPAGECSLGLMVLSADGTWKRGLEATKYIRDNPPLTAIFSAAGLDPTIQKAQISAAVAQKITAPLLADIKERKSSKCKQQKDAISKTYKIQDIFTSEYGVGLIADTAVHEGSGFLLGQLWETWCMISETERENPALVEGTMYSFHKWPDRSKAFADKCNKAVRSYVK